MKLREILKYDTITGIEVHLKGSSVDELYLVELKREKNLLKIQRQLAEIDDTDTLLKLINPKYPIVLSVSGKGVIHKPVNLEDENVSLEEIAAKALPGFNSTEFTCVLKRISETKGFISFIRTEQLNKILAQFSKNGLNDLAGFLLGPLSLSGFLDVEMTEVIIPGSMVVMNKGIITEIKTLGELDQLGDISIGDEIVPAAVLTAMANAASYFSGNNLVKTNSEQVKLMFEEFEHRSVFRIRAFSTAVAAFLIVVVNMFVFMHYADKSKDLQRVCLQNEAMLVQLDILKSELNFKKKFLEENALLTGSRTSFYGDRIAREIPQSVILTSLDIHPLKKATEDSPLSYENDLIKIKGKCREGNELNKWLKVMRSYNWVSEVVLENYERIKENEAGTFSVQVKLKE